MTKLIPVVVTTAHRGVFFGYIDETKVNEDNISLKSARNCLYWSATTQGFLGLAAKGPAGGSRVGPAVDIDKLTNITCIARCTKEAEKVWKEIKWN